MKMKTKSLFAPGVLLSSTIKRRLITVFVAILFIGSTCGQEILYNFPGPPGGITLMQGSAGDFYGTIYSGGSSNLGTIFKMTSDGVVTNLVSFNSTNGANPIAKLVQGIDGSFYGTTSAGGSNNLGTIFKVTTDGTLTTLVTFNGSNGGVPEAALVAGNDGNFYGTTYWGGNLALNGGSGFGTIFKMTPSGTLTKLVSLDGTKGVNPTAGIIQGADGNFYGTTQFGGTANLGTVFKMTAVGALTTLASFSATNGGYPRAGLVQGGDGNFYGTTYWGGNLALNGGGGGYGTVFKITPGGTLTTLVAFDVTNGGHPNAGLIQANDGNFYGTTFGGGDLPVDSGNSYGTVFRLTSTGDLTTLVSFTIDNGAYPFDGVFQAGDGEFYGTTGDGPAGGHTIFRLNLSQSLSFTQQPGDRSVSVGATVLFQSIALGEPPLAYQWYLNGNAISNATSPDLAIANVQSTNAGNYIVVVTNYTGSVTSRVATLFQPAFAQFTQVTTGAIVTDLGIFTRGAWGDFNNDGFLDLFVSDYNNRTNVFYLNHGDGTFTKVTEADPVQDADNHTGAAAADFDNDGNLDLIVSAGVAAQRTRNLLYLGNGDGTFTRGGGGLTNRLGNFSACAWADYDNDGFVDLFITDNGTNNGGAKNLLLHNNGNGTFGSITSGDIVTNIGIGLGALWADYDNDGFMDLVVINIGPTNNFLYHNNGNGTFTRILTNAIATDSWPVGAQGGAWGDYDNDGLPDLFVTDNGGFRNHLYHNNSNGNFTNITSGSELQPPSSIGCEGCSWGDYDNDGYLDLFVCGTGGNNGFYHNNGDGTFTQITNEPPVNGGGPDFNCASVAWVDYDNDGFLDLFLTRGNANTPTSNLLFHNNGNTNGWLEIKLIGTIANRSAIGAKVRVKATIHGKTFWQLREITGGGGWNLQPLMAHFGLGDATNIDTLRIEWPSGTLQEFHDVAPKQILTITEPPRLITSVTNGVPQFSFKGGRNLQYEVESSMDLKTWSLIVMVTVTNLNGITPIIDNNPSTSVRFYRIKQLAP
jgi:uncharacterized repeat protein (TIGR03803 family)